MHRESMSIIVQQDETMYSLLYFFKQLYIFLVVPPPSGTHITVITASGTGQINSSTFHYRGGVGPVPDAVIAVICFPDDGWGYHPKHVEQFAEI